MLSRSYTYHIVLNVPMTLQIQICCSKCRLPIDIALFSCYAIKYMLIDLSSCPDGVIVANMRHIMTVRGDRMDYTHRLLLCSLLFSFFLFPSILLCAVLLRPVLLLSVPAHSMLLFLFQCVLMF
jgi:hypothetical protein